MGRKKQLKIVQTSHQYANGNEYGNGCSLPHVASPEEFENDGIHDEQQDDELHNIHAGHDDEVKTRRGTTLTHVWDLPAGKRIVVKCNKLGQPIGAEGGLLGQFLGTIARNGGYCPLDMENWRKVKEDGGDLTILQFVQTKFLYPHSCEKWVLKTTGRNWRRYKAALKKRLFKPKKKRAALYRLCPEDIDEYQWEALVNYWKSKKGKALSEKNKASRALLKNTHSAGTKSYARWGEDMRQEDPEKKQPHRAKVYLATHKKRGKHNEEHVDALEKLIDEQPVLAQNDQGRVAWEGDALHKVLGKEKPGQVHGMGLLPVPKQVYGRTSHHLKNINITTIDGSSSDGEMHVIGEMEELKERLNKQGQLIEELLKKQSCNGNSEPTMVNFQSAYDDNNQQGAIRSNRKRIQCNAPEHEGSLSERTNTLMNKERYMEQQNMHDDDLMISGNKPHERGKQINRPRPDESSSLQPAHDFRHVINKKQKLQKDTIITQQKDTQNKTLCRQAKSKMHISSMKVGTTVVLKTSKYPNKEYVAYATFLSSNPHDKVDGVEIGNQFTKVVVNHALVEKEELVRPMKHCNTIGDAISQGTTIAWPSLFVEKITP